MWNPSFYFIFCCFLCPVPSRSQVPHLLNGSYKIHNIAFGPIVCDYIMSERSKIWKLMQFNTSWLASRRTWYYFRFCFGFIFSGYDLTLTKKSHALNFYSFLQRFLLKTKTYKLVVGNCGSSIYCKNKKCRKSYLFLVIYVLINK